MSRVFAVARMVIFHGELTAPFLGQAHASMFHPVAAAFNLDPQTTWPLFLACTYMRQYGALVCENMHAAISQIAFAVKWTFATIKHSGPAGAPDVPDVITRNRRLGRMPEGIKHGQVPGRAPITLLPSPSLQHEGAKNFP